MLTLELFKQVVGWITAGATGLFLAIYVGRFAWREVGKPVWRFGKGVSSLSELVPNGGTSIKDQITGVCAQVKNIDDKVTKIDARLALTTAITLADFDNDPSPKLRLGTDLGLENASSATLSILHLNLTEAFGHGWKTALPSIQRQTVTDELQRAKEEKRRCTVELIILKNPAHQTPNDGDHYILQLIPLPGHGQEFLGFIGYLTPLAPSAGVGE